MGKLILLTGCSLIHFRQQTGLFHQIPDMGILWEISKVLGGCSPRLPGQFSIGIQIPFLQGLANSTTSKVQSVLNTNNNNNNNNKKECNHNYVSNGSLRSKRFRRLFRALEVFFVVWPSENWGEGKKYSLPQLFARPESENCFKLAETLWKRLQLRV